MFERDPDRTMDVGRPTLVQRGDGLMAKEYRRVCQRCETEWYVPSALAKERAPSRLEIAGRKVQATGSSMSIVSFSKSRDQAKLANAQEKRQRVLDNSRCPSCGSIKFKQTRARR